MSAKVFVVILNWNGKDDTIECLKSVSKINYSNYEVIVVDNASGDGSVATIRRVFPAVTLIENKSNLGFAAGNNVGIRYALDKGADFILLLNNDTTVDADLLNELVAAYGTIPVAAFLGGKIFFYDKPDIIQYYGGRYSESHILEGHHNGEGEKDDGRFNDVIESEYITGCAIFAHRSLLENIGLLDERFFVYWEDGDWCLRAKSAGFKNYVIPGAKLWHKVSRSTGGGSPISTFYVTRNRILFAKKHGYEVHFIMWSYYLISKVLKTRWDQRVTAAFYILFGHITGALGIYGKIPGLFERNIVGGAERRLRSSYSYCKKILKQLIVGVGVVFD